MSEKEAPVWRETNGETGGVPWRLRTMKVGVFEITLGTGFGDGVRLGMRIDRPDGDCGEHPDDVTALRAAADMLGIVAEQADDFGDYLRERADVVRRIAPSHGRTR